MKNKILSVALLLMVGLIGYSFIGVDQSDAWPVPDEYEKMDNPVKFDKKLATALWMKHCKSCHGKDGLGDGPKAAQLDTPAGDFSSAKFQKQSDGSLFYKTFKGRDDMPGYEKKIREKEDMWQLVHLMRTFE